MQKENKVYNITPANRVGTGILLFQETERSSRNERRW